MIFVLYLHIPLLLSHLKGFLNKEKSQRVRCDLSQDQCRYFCFIKLQRIELQKRFKNCSSSNTCGCKEENSRDLIHNTYLIHNCFISVPFL